MAIDKTVGQKIKYLRKQKNITQTDLGVAVFNKSDSASQNTIKNIETGRRKTKPEELSEILTQLDTSNYEFNGLNLHDDNYTNSKSEQNVIFPEIDYYNKMFEQASKAGDEYMKLQIYKAMLNRLDKKIKAQEVFINESSVKKSAGKD